MLLAFFENLRAIVVVALLGKAGHPVLGSVKMDEPVPSHTD